MNDHVTDPATEAFVAHRNLLFTVAYEMLGSAADAEDVLQEAWLRWVKVDLAQVRDQRAYLVRITTRQALNRLRTLKRRKEAYVGPWLPEPLLTAPDVAEDVELSENLSLALMYILETLSPTERAVFVLREVFEFGYDDIAAAIGKSPAAARQIAYRARRHVDARRPRDTGFPGRSPGGAGIVPVARSRPGTCRDCSTYSPRTSSSSATAAASGWRPCGRSSAPTRCSATWPAVSTRRAAPAHQSSPRRSTATPALVLRLDGVIDGVLAFRVENARVTGLYYVRNPEKLTRVESETPLTSR